MKVLCSAEQTAAHTIEHTVPNRVMFCPYQRAPSPRRTEICRIAELLKGTKVCHAKKYLCFVLHSTPFTNCCPGIMIHVSVCHHSARKSTPCACTTFCHANTPRCRSQISTPRTAAPELAPPTTDPPSTPTIILLAPCHHNERLSTYTPEGIGPASHERRE